MSSNGTTAVGSPRCPGANRPAATVTVRVMATTGVNQLMVLPGAVRHGRSAAMRFSTSWVSARSTDSVVRAA